MSEWFEDESFWTDLYPFMFSEKKFEVVEEEVEKIFTLTGFKGNNVLDLCCGPGRHATAIAKKGIKVTGVDRTVFLLDKAKERAGAEKVEVEWILEDMRDFLRPGTYDLVLSMFTSFGYFDDKNDDAKVLNNIYRSLKPGGACILEMTGKEWLAKVFTPTISSECEDGSLLVQRHEIFDDWSRIRNEWILIKNGKAKSFKFHHTIYSG